MVYGFPPFPLPLSPWSQAKLTTPNHDISVIITACKGAWTASKPIIWGWLHLVAALQEERRKKRDLKLLFTFQTQPPPGLRTCFMRKKGAEPIGSDTVPSPAELKTTWHYSKWNWCTDRLPTPEGEGPHNTPLFPLRDQTILLLLLLGMRTIQKHCHGHQDQGHTKFRWSCNLLYQRKEREGKELKLNTDDYHWSEQHWQLTIVIFPSFKKYTHFQFCQARRSPRTQQCLYPSTSAALDSPWRLSSL